MLRRLVKLVVTAVVGFVGFVFVAMRTRSPWMLTAVRRFNRSVTNRLQTRTAGTPGSGTALIRHKGRTTGRPYETPIGAFPIDGGFLVSLPYGPTTDWVRNVLAAGSAELVRDGQTIRVDAPEVLPVGDVQHLFPENEQRVQRLFNVQHCLRLRRADG